MNSRPCIYHFWLGGDCELCGAPRSEMHWGLDHKGIFRACIQEVHFCQRRGSR